MAMPDDEPAGTKSEDADNDSSNEFQRKRSLKFMMKR